MLLSDPWAQSPGLKKSPLNTDRVLGCETVNQQEQEPQWTFLYFVCILRAGELPRDVEEGRGMFCSLPASDFFPGDTFLESTWRQWGLFTFRLLLVRGSVMVTLLQWEALYRQLMWRKSCGLPLSWCLKGQARRDSSLTNDSLLPALFRSGVLSERFLDKTKCLFWFLHILIKLYHPNTFH